MANMVDIAQGQAAQATDMSGVGKGTLEGLSAGMGLAERKAKLEEQKQQIEQDRQKFEMNKWGHVFSSLQDITAEPNDEIRKLKADKYVQEMATLGERVPPETYNLLLKSEYARDRLNKAAKLMSSAATENPQEFSKSIESLGPVVFGDTYKLLEGTTKIIDAGAKRDVMRAQMQVKQESLQQRQDKFGSDVENKVLGDETIKMNKGLNQSAGKALEILNRKDVKWIDLNEAFTDITNILQNGKGAVSVTREDKQSFSDFKSWFDKNKGKITGKEEGGPSQEELDLVKDRLGRLNETIAKYHDQQLMKNIQTKHDLLSKYGRDPEQIFENNKLSPDSEFSMTPVTQQKPSLHSKAPPLSTEAGSEMNKKKVSGAMKSKARETAKKLIEKNPDKEQDIKTNFQNHFGEEL